MYRKNEALYVHLFKKKTAIRPLFREHYETALTEVPVFPKLTVYKRWPFQMLHFRLLLSQSTARAVSLPLSDQTETMASTQKCIEKESCTPGAVPKGLVRVYSMRFCPYAQRTRLVLHAKSIEHEILNINLKAKPDWYFEKNPHGTVPALETPCGQVVYESVITCEYLDELYSEKKLFPSDPFAKAQQKMLLEEYSKVIPLFYNIPFAKKKGEDVSALEAELKEKLTKLNKVLVNKKTKCFGGDSVTMIDYLIWPWFERVEAWELKHCLDATSELNNWILQMQKDPTVKALMFSTDAHKAFFTSFMDGKPNYDYGL